MDISSQTLVPVLQAAAEARSGNQQAAEAQLQQWETVPGFYRGLQAVYLNLELPLQVRWLAVILFKNGVDKYWRLLRANAVGKIEKAEIRARMFELVHEPNKQLMAQNARAVARVARFDFPAEWPQLFEQVEAMLLAGLRNADTVSLHNLLLVLNQVIKELAMVRVGRARTAMQAKAPLITGVLVRLYHHFFREWTATMDLLAMEVGYLTLKCLRRLVVDGYEQPEKDRDCAEFVDTTLNHFQLLVDQHDLYLLDLLERYVKGYVKLYHTLAESNPCAFALMPCSRQILTTMLQVLLGKAVQMYNAGDGSDAASAVFGSVYSAIGETDAEFWEALAVKALLVLRCAIQFVYKKGAVTLRLRGDKAEMEQAVKKLSLEVFTADAVRQLVDLLVRWYLRLRPGDLEEWALEPEAWVTEALSLASEYQVRPCAENFFEHLVQSFNDTLGPYVMAKLLLDMQATPADDVLAKDAVLTMLQLLSSVLANEIDFDQVLVELLVPEAALQQQLALRIVQRRVLLVVSSWVNVKCSPASRVTIFRLLLDLLQPLPTHDLVVRLTAVQTMVHVVDDWEFRPRDFAPYAAPFLARCVAMLQEVELPELRLYLLKAMLVVLERAGTVVDYATLLGIVPLVPQVWEAELAQGETITRSSLIRVLSHVVAALGERLADAHAVSFPLITACCQELLELYAVMLEDGFELWLEVLRHWPTAASPAGAVELFLLVPHALRHATEVLPLVLSLARSYALLAPAVFATPAGVECLQIAGEYLPQMRDDALEVFVAWCDTLAMVAPSAELWTLLGVFAALVHFCVTDELLVRFSANSVLLVLARLAVADPYRFVQMAEATPDGCLLLVQAWLEGYRHLQTPRNKKIHLLALLALMRTQSNAWAPHAGAILAHAVTALEEINEGKDGDCEAYHSSYLYEFEEGVDSEYYEAPPPLSEQKRYRQAVADHDVVHRVRVREYTAETLKFLQQELGDRFNELVALLDPATVEALQSVV